MATHELAAAADPSAREGATPPGETWPPGRGCLPDPDLLAHIVERHHAHERGALPYVVALLAKVAGSHRRRNAKLGVLCDVGQELADALEAHHEAEAGEIFPALLAGASAPEVARAGRERATRHHRALELLLARIRWLADDFAVPEWGGRSYQALMEELEALEEGVLEHMHLVSAALGSRPA